MGFIFKTEAGPFKARPPFARQFGYILGLPASTSPVLLYVPEQHRTDHTRTEQNRTDLNRIEKKNEAA